MTLTLIPRIERVARSMLKRCPCCNGPLPLEIDLRVDLGTNTVFGYGRAAHIPPRHAELIFLLVEKFPNLVQRQTLIERLWPRQDISDKLLDATVCLTRRYVERVGYSIKNEYGVGYRLARLEMEQ